MNAVVRASVTLGVRLRRQRPGRRGLAIDRGSTAPDIEAPRTKSAGKLRADFETSFSAVTASSGSFKSSAPRLSSNCAAFRAPMMVEVTPGLDCTQLRATRAGVGVRGELRGDHRALAPRRVAPDVVADDLFRVAAGIRVGGVDEVPAATHEGVHDRFRLLHAAAPAPVFAKGHGAKAERAHREAAVAEGEVVIERHGWNIAARMRPPLNATLGISCSR